MDNDLKRLICVSMQNQVAIDQSINKLNKAMSVITQNQVNTHDLVASMVKELREITDLLRTITQNKLS